IQAPVSSELNPFPFTIYYDTNAGKAHSQGIEFEAQFQATRQLRLETAVGYVKAIIDDLTLVDTGTEIASDYAGLRIPNARPWTASASAIYSRPMGESVATFRLDHRYQDSVQQSRILPDPNFQLPSFQTTDLSIALMRDRWDLTAYIENLFDEAYFTSVSSTSICCGYRGRMVNAPPRMFGMRLNYRFAD
ncbi:TonB-dependent receptor domain-containing protein, partial [Steroidobacter sp.]|uniref:TonB-dependent receptor domain-containing protein n=1 Tax=Steroidobacter sp. TaxID=1978227 RepID=UPI001A4A8BDC